MGRSPSRLKKLFFEGDLVGHTLETQKGPFCVLTSQFKRKEAVAWRIRVLESTGDVADDKVLKSVVVELGDGQGVAVHPRDPQQVVGVSKTGQVFTTEDGGDNWSEQRLPAGAGDCYAIACG